MIKIILLVCLFSYDKIGMSGAQFLQIGMGARAQALAGSVCAVGGDVTSIYWNPAGLSQISNYEFFAGYSRWIETITFAQSAFGVRRGNISYGIQLISMSMDPVEITTVEEPEGTGAYFSASGTALGGAASLILTDRLRIGFGAKVVHEQIYNCTADGFAFDFGSIFEMVKGGLTIGMVLSNFGTDMQFKGRDLAIGFNPEFLGTTYYETSKYPLPLVMRVGLSYPFEVGQNAKGLVLIQSEHPNDNRERYSIGFEIEFNKVLALRSGYILGHDTQNYSGGLGLLVPIPWAIVSIDMAYVSRGQLKPQIYLSVSFKGR